MSDVHPSCSRTPKADAAFCHSPGLYDPGWTVRYSPPPSSLSRPVASCENSNTCGADASLSISVYPGSHSLQHLKDLSTQASESVGFGEEGKLPARPYLAQPRMAQQRIRPHPGPCASGGHELPVVNYSNPERSQKGSRWLDHHTASSLLSHEFLGQDFILLSL